MRQSLFSDKHRPVELNYSQKGRFSFTATAVAPTVTEGSWSLAQLQGETSQDFFFRLGLELRNRNILHAFAPPVKYMSGRVVEPQSLTTVYALRFGVKIFRAGKNEDGSEIQSDGCRLSRGDAFVMSGGGCPIVVAYGVNDQGEEVFMACHVGRESAIDPFYLGESGSPRRHFSAVGSLVAMAQKHGVQAEQLTMRTFFQIPTQRFTHPTTESPHAPRNQKILKVITERYPNPESIMPVIGGIHCLDMGELVRQQAIIAGIPHGSVNNCPLPENGPFGDTRHANPLLAKSSNLEIIHFE